MGNLVNCVQKIFEWLIHACVLNYTDMYNLTHTCTCLVDVRIWTSVCSHNKVSNIMNCKTKMYLSQDRYVSVKCFYIPFTDALYSTDWHLQWHNGYSNKYTYYIYMLLCLLYSCHRRGQPVCRQNLTELSRFPWLVSSNNGLPYHNKNCTLMSLNGLVLGWTLKYANYIVHCSYLVNGLLHIFE